MRKTELLKLLKRLAKSYDIENAHGDADDALVVFINDPEITKAYEAVPKWYA